jgi:hypothetical protein
MRVKRKTRIPEMKKLVWKALEVYSVPLSPSGYLKKYPSSSTVYD